MKSGETTFAQIVCGIGPSAENKTVLCSSCKIQCLPPKSAGSDTIKIGRPESQLFKCGACNRYDGRCLTERKKDPVLLADWAKLTPSQREGFKQANKTLQGSALAEAMQCWVKLQKIQFEKSSDGSRGVGQTVSQLKNKEGYNDDEIKNIQEKADKYYDNAVGGDRYPSIIVIRRRI